VSGQNENSYWGSTKVFLHIKLTCIEAKPVAMTAEVSFEIVCPTLYLLKYEKNKVVFVLTQVPRHEGDCKNGILAPRILSLRTI
jgi:hypothetical protein